MIGNTDTGNATSSNTDYTAIQFSSDEHDSNDSNDSTDSSNSNWRKDGLCSRVLSIGATMSAFGWICIDLQDAQHYQADSMTVASAAMLSIASVAWATNAYTRFGPPEENVVLRRTFYATAYSGVFTATMEGISLLFADRVPFVSAALVGSIVAFLSETAHECN